jgi:hypothetical protein
MPLDAQVRVRVIGIKGILDLITGNGLLEPASFDVGEVLDHAEKSGPRRDHRAFQILVGEALANGEDRRSVMVEEAGENLLLRPGNGRPVSFSHFEKLPLAEFHFSGQLSVVSPGKTGINGVTACTSMGDSVHVLGLATAWRY